MTRKAGKKTRSNNPATGAPAEEPNRFTGVENQMHEVQEELDELRVLSSKLLEVGVAISSEIDLYALLTRIIDEAKKLLKARSGTRSSLSPTTHACCGFRSLCKPRLSAAYR